MEKAAHGLLCSEPCAGGPGAGSGKGQADPRSRGDGTRGGRRATQSRLDVHSRRVTPGSLRATGAYPGAPGRRECREGPVHCGCPFHVVRWEPGSHGKHLEDVVRVQLSLLQQENEQGGRSMPLVFKALLDPQFSVGPALQTEMPISALCSAHLKGPLERSGVSHSLRGGSPEVDVGPRTPL